MSRRRRSPVSTGAIAVIGGALLLFPLLTAAARAATTVRMNPNVYTAGACETNPEASDPTDKTMFTYNVDWTYSENDVVLEGGRVGRFTVQGSSGGDIDVSHPIDPIPKYIRDMNPLGIEPNDWWDCPSPPNPWVSYLCKPSKPEDGCCSVFTFPPGENTGNPPIHHALNYRVSIDPCLDRCHYEPCVEYHDIPKGGGVPMVFKYIRHEDASCEINSQYCDQYTNYAPCGWATGPFGRYRAKCYILIQ